MGFDQWIKEVALLCWSNYGMSIHVLPDMCLRDAFDGEVNPLQFFLVDLGTVDDLAKCLS